MSESVQNDKAHISDEELVLFSDQELSTHRAGKVREHVAQCVPCQMRLTELENVSASFADLHEQEIQTHNAYSSNSRDSLKARLAETAMRNGDSRSATFRRGAARQLISACIALLVVGGGTWTVRHIALGRSDSDAKKTEAIALPRRALTPGFTRAVPVADLCSGQDLDNDPPVNPSLERAVLREYGIPASSKKNYELDYLIAPALGGTDSIQNLWPQPYSATWNARVKDQLEDHLHELVCQGKMQLATAQNDIATDWIAAYKRYFNTDKPKLNSSAASTRPRLARTDRIQADSTTYDFAPDAVVLGAFPVNVSAKSEKTRRLSATKRRVVGGCDGIIKTPS